MQYYASFVLNKDPLKDFKLNNRREKSKNIYYIKANIMTVQ